MSIQRDDKFRALLSTDPFLTLYIRVLRGNDSLQHLIETFPILEQRALSSSLVLTDHERRQILDLPDASEEATNIQHVSQLSRQDLLSTALLNSSSLSDDEISLLHWKFWTSYSRQESQARFNSLLHGNQKFCDRIYAAREAAYLPDESRALTMASSEYFRRAKEFRDVQQRNTRPPGLEIPRWMESLSQRLNGKTGQRAWGFLAFYDTEMQILMSDDHRDLFSCTVSGTLMQTMRNNGAHSSILTSFWRLKKVNGPSTDTVSTEMKDDHSSMRAAFHDLIQDSGNDVALYYNGLLTNTFLVITKACVESVLKHPPYLNGMRILAVEADFPQSGRSYSK